jgi:hypothetical protein
MNPEVYLTTEQKVKREEWFLFFSNNIIIKE